MTNILEEIMKAGAVPIGRVSIPGRGNSEYEVSIDPEVQVIRLREKYERYQKMLGGCPFSPGDLITPIGDAAIKGVGQPHVVLEVRAPSAVQPLFAPGDPSSGQNGVRQDIRVAVMVDNDNIVSFWVESYEYEPWEPE